TGISPVVWGLSLSLIFVGLNLLGVEGAANLEVVLVTGLIAVMGGFVLFGAPRVDFERFRSFFTSGVNGMLFTAAFVFVSFGGLLQAATIAEEVKDPQKSLRQGTFLTVGVVTLLYMSIVTVTTGLLDGAEFRESLTPVADAAAVILGRPGRIILSTAASLTFITTALAGLMSASRYPLALARDGLLPRFLSVVFRKNGTPGPSIILTGILAAVGLQLNLDLLVKSASAVFMITCILDNIAVIVLRVSRLSNYKSLFIAPFYPWLQALSILLYLFFLADMGREAFAIALGFVSLSLLIFHLYGRHRVQHDFALVHLLKRVVDARWRDEGLEKELLGIITMRDRVPIDSIPCIDLDDSVVLLDDLWRRIAQDLSPNIKVSTETLEYALREREGQYSTALTPFTVIPHVVLDGDTRQFAVSCYRSRAGLRFSESAPAVHALFACAGTDNLRHLHLEALAAIARFVEQPEFENLWEWAEWLKKNCPRRGRY
ncbi:MAG: amino acid permease, partial [Spirochaetaceae bacterium]|nr:amino acid permease [Spirochaetaceae bacterium]